MEEAKMFRDFSEFFRWRWITYHGQGLLWSWEDN